MRISTIGRLNKTDGNSTKLLFQSEARAGRRKAGTPVAT